MKDKSYPNKSKNFIASFFNSLSPWGKASVYGLIGAFNIVAIHYHISYLNMCSSEYPAFIQVSGGSLLSNANANTMSGGGELAVIHMGIHKTGSSVIQDATREFSTKLLEDGYEMPWTHSKATESKRVDQNQVTFSECFAPSGDTTFGYACVPELLMYGMQIAKRQNNLFISAESFSAIEGEQVENLVTYLSQWKKTTVIIYYRHYFDYLRSKGNQEFKNRKLSQKHLWEEDELDYLTTFAIDRYPGHTSALMPRLKPYFDDIVIVDYHDKSKGLLEKFFCDILPGARNTCKEVKNAGEDESINSNLSVDLGFSSLAYAAMKKNLIKITSDEQMTQVSDKVKEYIEQTLGTKTSEMKRKCLPPETMEALLEASLEFQVEIFPSATGDDLRELFEKTKSQLCILDTERTLEEERWKKFFQELEFHYSS